MSNELKDLNVAILATNGFEESELAKPKEGLENAGANVQIVSPESGKIKGWRHDKWGNEFTVDVELKSAQPKNYQALVLPGGVMNPDKLRMDPQAIEFIEHFVKENKPIAAICHGPWTLINAKGVSGKKMTSWPSIKIDLVNAGANWVDSEVARDDKLITSRKPDDIPAFINEMIKVFKECNKTKAAP